MPTIEIDLAGNQLANLIDAAKNGEEILLAKDGNPVARLVAIDKPTPHRKFGSMKGKIWIAEDFDAPLPDHSSRPL